MRNIFVLEQAIKAEIPDEPQWNWLRVELHRITFEHRYKAPELWRTWFDSVAKILSAELKEPNTDWKKKIADIFADKIKVGA